MPHSKEDAMHTIVAFTPVLAALLNEKASKTRPLHS